MNFKDKAVIITGAAGNIGLATAHRFADEGARLALVDVDAQALEKARAELKLPPERCIAVTADVSRETDVARYVSETVAAFGRVDVFFNNAGVGGARNHIVDLDLDEWKRVMGVDMVGVLLGMKHVLRVMYEQGSGSIINTASQAGVFNQPGGAGYCLAKGAVIHMTKIAAVEAGPHGIHVNCIMPGLVDSDMIRRNAPDPEQMIATLSQTVPLGRMASLKDVANAVCFLASEEAAYINGAELRIDGGSSIN